jgi:hypothetical protein
MLVILALGRIRQEDCEFKAKMDFMANCCLKKKKKKEEG